MHSESPLNNIQRNTVLNVAGAIVPLGVSLITVPIYLKLIGEARYGIIAIIWVLFGYFALFDLGLGRATIYYVAKFRGKALTEEVERLFWTGLASNALFGLVGGLILLSTGRFLFNYILEIPLDLLPEAVSVLPWLGLAIPVLTVSSVLLGSLEGQERFLSINVLTALITVLTQLVPLAVAYWIGPQLGPLIGSIVVTRALGLVVIFLVCVKLLSLTTPPTIDLNSFRRLFKYGRWVTVTGVLAPILTTLDQFVIGAALGVRQVTYYSIPYNLVTRILILPQGLSRTLFPRFSMLRNDEAQRMGHQMIMTLAAVVTPVIVLAMFAIEPFLTFWVGSPISTFSAPVGRILLVGIWINGLALIPYALVRGQGRPDLTAKFHTMELPLFLVALFIGIQIAGLQGAALAWTLRVLMDLLLLLFASRIPVRGIVSLVPAGALVIASGTIAYLINSWLWRSLMVALCALLSIFWAYFVAPPLLKDQIVIIGQRVKKLRGMRTSELQQQELG